MGNELIVHGGMHLGEEEEQQNNPSTISTPSNTYATYKAASVWEALSDVWVFNLETLKWKERVMYPQLARSYHSMIGWGNGTVAAFGGFQQDNNVPTREVSCTLNYLLCLRMVHTH